MKRFLGTICLLGLLPALAHAQEANAGFGLRATVSAEIAGSPLLTDDPRNGSPVIGGFRTSFYPILKLGDHWAATACFQTYSRPYFFDGFKNSGDGVNSNLLQGSLNYARVAPDGSLVIRAGQLSTAFGAFLLRYDDADNPLADMPLEYGYYGPVSVHGLLAAQVDGTRGRWDGRVQFSNSSPANPRSITASDQYGNWSGGAGFTPREGLRIGASAFRGPYLDRHGEHFLPGELNPSKLAASAYGTDGAWTHGHLTLQGEWQHFTMPYTVMAPVHERAGYAEAKFAFKPRWYTAARGGYVSGTDDGRVVSTETAVGFRPNRLQLLKLDYELRRYEQGSQTYQHAVTLQWVTSWAGMPGLPRRSAYHAQP